MSLCINPHCPHPQNFDNVLFCKACGSELLLEGKYRVTRLLGQGGFGYSYEIRSQHATKVLKVLMNNSSKAVSLFQREIQVLRQLNHPGIPKVESGGYFIFHPKNSSEPLHCLVMEKIEGLNLKEYIQQRGNRPITGEVALDWLTQLVTILDEIHQRNIYHRDIKPQNIMLKPDGNLALIDFGTVREGTGTAAATNAIGGGTVVISAGYTPQEQINGQVVLQSDFFALGRTFVFLLTGKEPFDRAMCDNLNDELRWRSYASGIWPQLADLIDQMMARLPSQRPANTQMILRDLAGIDGSLRLNPLIPNSPPPPAPLPVALSATPSVVAYAGFWRRVVANIIDSFIIFVLMLMCVLMLGVFISILVISDVPEEDVADGDFGFLLQQLYSLLGWFYKTIMESSSQQATLGKKVMGIIVTDMSGRRISFGKANARYWSGIFSLLSFGIGYLMAGFTGKKQALHDLISDCLVVKKN